MVDEPVSDSPNQPEGPDRRDRRGLWSLLATIAVVVIVVLVFLMLRGCDTGSRGGDTGSTSDKQIVPVAGLKAVPGSVSVWVAKDSDISAVLVVAGIRDAPVTNMGGGRWVVTVPAGTEDKVIVALRGRAGVYDAGRVFTGAMNGSAGTGY